MSKPEAVAITDENILVVQHPPAMPAPRRVKVERRNSAGEVFESWYDPAEDANALVGMLARASENPSKACTSKSQVKYIAFHAPFWTDAEPYCDTIRLITPENAALWRRRTYRERNGVDYPGTDEMAVKDFMSANWAWYFDPPVIDED